MTFKLSDNLTKDQKQTLDVLENGESRRSKIWASCVKEAKGLIKLSDELRFKIIDLANKCCSDLEGSAYTYGRFADEIGMQRGTLYEWIKIKREVYDVLPKEDKSFLSFSQMRDLNSRSANSSAQDKGKAVLRALKQMKKESPDTIKFRTYLDRLNNILFNVKDKNRSKDVDRAVLAEMLHIAREISKHLNWVDFEIKDNK